MRVSVLILFMSILLLVGACSSPKEVKRSLTPEEMAQQQREVQAEDALNMATQLQHNSEYLDADAALDYLNQAIELNSSLFLAYYQRAMLYLDRKQLNRAMADIARVIELRPNHVEALFTRGYIYFLRQDYVAAVQSFSAVIEQDSTISQAYSMRGFCYGTMNRLEDAIYDYSQAIALNPALQEAYFNRGIAFSKMGDDEKAIQDFTQAVSLDSQSPKALMARANGYMRLAEFKRAAADYRRLSIITPTDSGVYALLAEAHAGAHEYDDAIAAAFKAQRLAQAQGDTRAATVYGEMIVQYQAAALQPRPEPEPEALDETESEKPETTPESETPQAD